MLAMDPPIPGPGLRRALSAVIVHFYLHSGGYPEYTSKNAP
jgi:hypothetical protein